MIKGFSVYRNLMGFELKIVHDDSSKDYFSLFSTEEKLNKTIKLLKQWGYKEI